MARASLEDRIRAVLLYNEGVKDAREISSVLDISIRTFWRWIRAYRAGGPRELALKKPGPERGRNAIPTTVEQRIASLKQKHPSWGARRIKYQYDLPCDWRTVHRVIKRRGMLVRIKPKPQPSKRFQRKHVGSMWQGDSFQFRISSVGKVYVTGFTDDRSRFRIASGVYLHKSAKEAVDALRLSLAEKRIPREIYLDNAKQFIAEEFKAEAKKHGIKLIFGKPYHPRGRGKIERYHEVLWQELITQKRFSSLSHFKRELRKFDRQYNCWRKIDCSLIPKESF
jgi:putative transposase